MELMELNELYEDARRHSKSLYDHMESKVKDDMRDYYEFVMLNKDVHSKDKATEALQFFTQDRLGRIFSVSKGSLAIKIEYLSLRRDTTETILVAHIPLGFYGNQLRLIDQLARECCKRQYAQPDDALKMEVLEE